MQKDRAEVDGRNSDEPKMRLPLSPAWEAKAERLIEKKAKGKFREPGHFAGKVFLKQFFPILARVYFDELAAYAESKHGFDKVRIAEELGLNASTLTRWVNGQNPPGADKFFAIAVLLLKKSLGDIPFSDRDAMLFRAVVEQLKSFARKYAVEPECGIDRFVFRCLIYAMKDRTSDKLLPGLKKVGASDREAALKTATDNLNTQLTRRYEAWNRTNAKKVLKPPTVLPSQLSLWLTNWGMAYTLLAYGTKSVFWELSDAKIRE